LNVWDNINYDLNWLRDRDLENQRVIDDLVRQRGNVVTVRRRLHSQQSRLKARPADLRRWLNVYARQIIQRACRFAYKR
jgi:hypothetical protein